MGSILAPHAPPLDSSSTTTISLFCSSTFSSLGSMTAKGVGVGVEVTSTIIFSITAGTGVLVGSGTLGFGVGGIGVGVGGTGVAGIFGKIKLTSLINSPAKN